MARTTIHQLSLIKEFLDSVPTDRQYLARFEDVLENPAEEVARLCNWLGRPRQAFRLEGFIDPERARRPSIRYSSDCEGHVAAILASTRELLGYPSAISVPPCSS